MKKLILTVLITLLLTGCTSTNKETLVIGFTDYPPMGFKDESGEVVGFDIDFAKAVTEVMGIEPVFQYINWDSKELELNSNQIDLIWNGFTVTPEREKEVLFSTPYIVNSIVAITLNTTDTITTEEDLSDKIIAVESESSGQHALEDTFETALTLNRFTTISEAILDLKAGNSDVIVADEIYARYLISKDSDVKVIEGISLKSEDYAVGMRLTDSELKEEINAAIKEVIDSGKASEISEKWFGEDIIR